MLLAKTLTAILVINGFLSFGCQKSDFSTTNKVVTSPLPTPEDPAQVSQKEYDAMLAVMHDGPIVVRTKTEATAAGAEASFLAKEFPGLPLDAIEDFKKKNAKVVSVECKFPTEQPCSLFTDDDIQAIWDFKHGGNANEKWEGFSSKYGTRYYYSISRVGFSSDGTKALAYAIGTCGTLCRNFNYYYLTKESSSWKIAKTVLTGVE
ncbi:MAG: hypothetical protein ABI623_10790 [bacterium]